MPGSDSRWKEASRKIFHTKPGKEVLKHCLRHRRKPHWSSAGSPEFCKERDGRENTFRKFINVYKKANACHNIGIFFLFKASVNTIFSRDFESLCETALLWKFLGRSLTWAP